MKRRSLIFGGLAAAGAAIFGTPEQKPAQSIAMEAKWHGDVIFHPPLKPGEIFYLQPGEQFSGFADQSLTPAWKPAEAMEYAGQIS